MVRNFWSLVGCCYFYVPFESIIINHFISDDSLLPPDDLYHCKNPNSTFQTTVSISCDPSTYLWALEELVPEQPPAMCGGPDFVISGDDLSNIQDWFEPCVHWAMIYGNLAPTTPPPTESTPDGTCTPVV